MKPNVTTKRVSVLLCGKADLTNESISDKLHVQDHIGRRKLKTSEFDCSVADLFWLSPRKYWTVSKGESCLQDLSLEIVNTFLEEGKDVVIVTEKGYRWRNKDPAKVLHQYHTTGHTVLCTRKLDNLCAIVGPSASEQLLNAAIASCFVLSLIHI